MSPQDIEGVIGLVMAITIAGGGIWYIRKLPNKEEERRRGMWNHEGHMSGPLETQAPITRPLHHEGTDPRQRR